MKVAQNIFNVGSWRFKITVEERLFGCVSKPFQFYFTSATGGVPKILRIVPIQLPPLTTFTGVGGGGAGGATAPPKVLIW